MKKITKKTYIIVLIMGLFISCESEKEDILTGALKFDQEKKQDKMRTFTDNVMVYL